MKIRSLLISMLSLLTLLLSGCDLDILLDQALLLDDPVTFVGERQIQVRLSGQDLETVKELGHDLDAYIARTLRSALPPAWEATWSLEKDAVILDFVLPFQGLEDYTLKVHQGGAATSYIDLAGSSSGSFPPNPPPDLAQLDQDIGREIFSHEGDFLQAGIRGLATAYFEPVRHELYLDDDLLFYLSLGEPGHWTKADLVYFESLPDPELESYYEIVQADFSDVVSSEAEPRLRLGSDLLILGDQVYETSLTGDQANLAGDPTNFSEDQANLAGDQTNLDGDLMSSSEGETSIAGDQVNLTGGHERLLKQSRILPLELEVTTYSDDLLRFSRTLRLRLPQDPTGESLQRLASRMNLGILDDLSFKPEGHPQNRIGAMSSKIIDVSRSQLIDYTRLLLGDSYTLELQETEATQFLWRESFELPAFFPSLGGVGATALSDSPVSPGNPDDPGIPASPDRPDGLINPAGPVSSTASIGPQIKILGLFDETLNDSSRVAEATLTARRSWPALALQTFWDKEAQVFVRRYHYYLDEGGTETILTEYLMEHSLNDDPIYSRSEDGYRHVFLEQRTEDPTAIAEQTGKLLGPTTIEVTEVNGLTGKKLNWVETYRFDKVTADQIIHLADGDSYQALRKRETMPRSGILTLNLTLQSNLGFLLGLAISGLGIATLLHPGSVLRSNLLKTKQRIDDYRRRKQREIEERPLSWGATFEDSKGRIVKLTSEEQSEPEPRRRLRFR